MVLYRRYIHHRKCRYIQCKYQNIILYHFENLKIAYENDQGKIMQQKFAIS